MPHLTSWKSPAACWAGALTLGAAVIHFGGALGQPVESTLLEQVLLGCAVIQTAAGAALLLRPNRTVLVLGAALNSAGVLIWIAVRSVGLRVGADVWQPETLGTPDCYLPTIQVLAAMLSAWALTQRLRHFSMALYAPIGLTALVVVGGVITYVVYPAAILVSLVNLTMIAGIRVTLLPGVGFTLGSIAWRQPPRSLRKASFRDTPRGWLTVSA